MSIYQSEEDRIQAEIDAAWEQYLDQQGDEAQEALDNEVCPCGHTWRQHYGDGGYCEHDRCDCPQFGEPPANYEEYTKVYLGDPGDDMGFVIYE